MTRQAEQWLTVIKQVVQCVPRGVLGVVVVIPLLLIGRSISLMASAATPPANQAAPSPLVWGTNLTLNDGQDTFLTSTTTQQLAQRMHVQMVRFPDRGNLAVTTKAAQTIKKLGMIPMVILHYDNLSADQQLITMMKRIFGSSTVYYEYGNESDYRGIDAARYTASWNAVVSQLKPLAPTGKFIGPVTFQSNPTYIASFLKGATPRPDMVSWHEYTCGTTDSDQYCLTHIANWTTHITQTRAAMQQAIGTTVPIMITEYNWNANAATDPRAQNATFLSSWTAQAIKTLMDNKVFAANQYVLTNNSSLAMISDATQQLTKQGQIFQATYEQAARVKGTAPFGTPAPDATLTPSATDATQTDPTQTDTTQSSTATETTPTGPAQQPTATETTQSSSTKACLPVYADATALQEGKPLSTLCWLVSPPDASSASPPTPTRGCLSVTVQGQQKPICVPITLPQSGDPMQN